MRRLGPGRARGAAPAAARRDLRHGASRGALGGLTALGLAVAAGAAPAHDPGREGRAPAGSWLAIQAAERRHDFAAAGPLLAEALLADPRDPRLLDGAAAAALALGDLDAALPPARALEATGAASLAARLALASDLARRGDWAGLLARLDEGRGVSPLLDGLLRGWAEMGLGHPDRAREAFRALAAEPGLAGFGLTHEALGLAVAGDPEGARAILGRPASEGMQRTRRGLMAEAMALGAMGRPGEGAALLEGAFGPAPDAEVAALRDALVQGTAPASLVASPREGVAEALLGVAEALPGEEEAEASLLHARAALLVAPGLDRAAVVAGERLGALGQPDLAAEALAQVPEPSPSRPAAEIALARVLRDRGEAERAADLLLALARRRPGQPEVEAALADHLRGLGRFAEAEAAYGRSIAGRGPGDGTLWFAHYARAVARESLGDWRGAEADLRRALALRPGQPQVLNRLGYALALRGERLPEALRLVEEAARLDPESGAVADSLGWTLFRLGRLPEAVEALERAASLEPTDATINDHLGDAYWAAGRLREARFQWSRALGEAPAAETEALRRKIAEGLPAGGTARPADRAALDPGAAGG